MKVRAIVKATAVALCAIGLILTTNWTALAAPPSCAFTYTVNGGLVTLTPTINGATYYQWIFTNETGVRGQTDWIPIENICNHIQGYVYPTSINICLSSKNNINQYTNYSVVITVFKSSFERLEITPEEAIPEPTNVFKEAVNSAGSWIDERDSGGLFFLFVVAIIVPLVLIKKKWPRKYIVYPILKKENR